MANPTDELKDTVRLIDNRSQDAFNAISAICGLALVALESPEGYRSITDLATSLVAIKDKADETRDRITEDAAQVGCNWVDEAEERRSKAYFASMDRVRARQMLEVAANV
jgi:phosphopantothenoylcysteine synthetase/decarboxylase